ncbi:hypothetical protein OH77DRAFT_1179456 [Trametes cingulata]|nr:hypothetical protein OH77DRAFT_1179456 [Trametes cingulata]
MGICAGAVAGGGVAMVCCPRPCTYGSMEHLERPLGSESGAQLAGWRDVRRAAYEHHVGPLCMSSRSERRGCFQCYLPVSASATSTGRTTTHGPWRRVADALRSMSLGAICHGLTARWGARNSN